MTTARAAMLLCTMALATQEVAGQRQRGRRNADRNQRGRPQGRPTPQGTPAPIPEEVPLPPRKERRVLANEVDFSLQFARQQFRNQFDAVDYTFDLLGVEGEVQEGGSIRPVDVRAMPALAGEGVAMTVFTIDACGVNLPHVHPRGTEILYVIRGDVGRFLQTAFVEPNGGRTLVSDIGVGELVVFPEGLLHYQQNLGCVESQYISGLNSEDPGVSTITFALFDIPKQGLAASLGQTEDEVARLTKGLPEGPAAGQAKCRQRCGLPPLPTRR